MSLPQLPQWNGMSFKERDKLLRWVAEFCDQKYWEGCKGLQLTEDMKLRDRWQCWSAGAWLGRAVLFS